MIDQLTSPTNSSIDQNILRLNSSSCCLVSPSQSNFGSNLKDNLIQFEQYKCNNSIIPAQQNTKKPSALGLGGIGKKKLTIQIDQSYDVSNNTQEIQRFEKEDKMEKNERGDKNKNKMNHGLELQPYSFESESRQIEDIELISPIENKNLIKILQLQQKIRDLEYKELTSNQIITQKNEKISLLEQKNKYWQSIVQKKDDEAEYKDSRLAYLQQKLKEKEGQAENLKEEVKKLEEKQLTDSFMNQIDQKMKQKDSKIRQLSKINQKLKNLNKDLIREVKASEKKVRDLQKQIQNNSCMVTQDNIHRMKQSSLKMKQKQNYERFNGSSHNHHTKTERDSIHNQHLNTTKQKESSFAVTAGSNVGRKSLQRKKNTGNNTTSAGQLSQPKKAGGTSKIGGSSSSNTILSKKLMHK